MAIDVHHGDRKRHPAIVSQQAARFENAQLRLADAITSFAGSMTFVYLHAVIFAAWMLLLEAKPWPTLTLVVSLEAIFLSTFVLIGQNRQAAFAQAKADHDFVKQELELEANTRMTSDIRDLAIALHRKIVEEDRR